MGYRIFISHSTHDRNWCEWLKNAAEELGIEAYLAEHDQRPGMHLAEKVQRAISQSHAVVVLITDKSRGAPYVQQEVGYAVRAKKLVIPLVQPGIPGEALAMLQGVEYISFDFAHPERGRDELVTSLHRLVERKQEREMLVAMACLALVLLAVTASE